MSQLKDKYGSDQDVQANQLVTMDHAAMVMHSIMGKALLIKGDIGAKENIRINGRIEGTVAVKNNHIEIGETGNVEANLFAKVVTISGEVKGNVYASEQINVTKSGKVHGDINAPQVCVEDGALLKGKINMNKQDFNMQQSISDEHHEKSSAFNFLFKKQREVQPVDQGHNSIKDLDLHAVDADSQSIHQQIPEAILNMLSPDRSLIGESVMIKGELISEEDVVIQGGVDGIIYLKNHSLALGPHALIKATLFIKSLVAQGEVNGHVYASEQVVLKKPCHHTGDIHSPRISIESGAVLLGGVEMEAQNIEEVFERLSGSQFAQQNVNVEAEKKEEDDDGTQTGSTTAKDWPIFYPRT